LIRNLAARLDLETMQPPVNYPSAAIRGQLRQWKGQLARRYRSVGRALADPAAKQLVLDMARRSTAPGRHRAFTKLQKRLGRDLNLQALRLDGKYPLALCAALAPRKSVITNGAPAWSQDCVAVNYLLAGVFPLPQQAALDNVGPGIADGLWSLEVPDHALGRLLERFPAASLAAILLEAHQHLLRLRVEALMPDQTCDPRRAFWVPAGPGAFVCILRHGFDVSLADRPMLFSSARTWVHTDMLYDDQILAVDDGAPGHRLGETYLLPAPLSRTFELDGGIAGFSWRPGLFEELATPSGTA
jgi:hypothetical protein